MAESPFVRFLAITTSVVAALAVNVRVLPPLKHKIPGIPWEGSQQFVGPAWIALILCILLLVFAGVMWTSMLFWSKLSRAMHRTDVNALPFRARVACTLVLIGGVLLVLGPLMTWFKTNVMQPGDLEYREKGVRFTQTGPWPRNTGPVSVNAFHLGQLNLYNPGWMHSVGTVFLVTGALLVLGALWQLFRPEVSVWLVGFAAIALAYLGSTDLTLTELPLDLSTYTYHGLYVYSTGFGYEVCRVGGPMAFAGCCWLLIERLAARRKPDDYQL